LFLCSIEKSKNQGIGSGTSLDVLRSFFAKRTEPIQERGTRHTSLTYCYQAHSRFRDIDSIWQRPVCRIERNACGAKHETFHPICVTYEVLIRLHAHRVIIVKVAPRLNQGRTQEEVNATLKNNHLF